MKLEHEPYSCRQDICTSTMCVRDWMQHSIRIVRVLAILANARDTLGQYSTWSNVRTRYDRIRHFVGIWIVSTLIRNLKKSEHKRIDRKG